MLRSLAVLAVVCCVSCQDPTDTSRRPTGSIRIAPNPVPYLQLGLPFYLVVITTGTDTAVTWSSSNTDVVRVDNRGTLVGVGIGGAMVTAWLTFDPTIRDSVSVSVAPGPITLPLIVANITAITDLNGTPVDSTAVRGSIRVLFATDIPSTILLSEGVDALLELRDSEVCRIRLISNPASHTCVVDTTRFGNGVASLGVDITRASDGMLLANSAKRTLTLAN